jgi:hypothetical protein
MTIERLLGVVPPPAMPVETYDGPWEGIEAELGTTLPQDYKDFVRLYGAGQFMEFLGIHVPKSWSPYVRLVSEARATAKLFASFEEELPYSLWPSAGGLLAFGKTDFADHLFWLTRGAPEDWPVVVWGRGLQQFEMFDCGLTDFLAGVATGQIVPEDFPEGDCDCLFEPGPGTPDRERLGLAGAPTASFSISWRFGWFGSGGSGVSTIRMRDEAYLAWERLALR